MVEPGAQHGRGLPPVLRRAEHDDRIRRRRRDPATPPRARRSPTRPRAAPRRLRPRCTSGGGAANGVASRASPEATEVTGPWVRPATQRARPRSERAKVSSLRVERGGVHLAVRGRGGEAVQLPKQRAPDRRRGHARRESDVGEHRRREGRRGRFARGLPRRCAAAPRLRARARRATPLHLALRGLASSARHASMARDGARRSGQAPCALARELPGERREQARTCR